MEEEETAALCCEWSSAAMASAIASTSVSCRRRSSASSKPAALQQEIPAAPTGSLTPGTSTTLLLDFLLEMLPVLEMVPEMLLKPNSELYHSLYEVR